MMVIDYKTPKRIGVHSDDQESGEGNNALSLEKNYRIRKITILQPPVWFMQAQSIDRC